MTFLEESQKLMREFQSHTKGPEKNWDLEAIFRILHTLKGGTASHSSSDMLTCIHKLEGLITQLKQTPRKFNRFKWDQLSQRLFQHYFKFQSERNKLPATEIDSHATHVKIPKDELAKILDLLSSWSKTHEWAAELKNQFFSTTLQQSFESYEYFIQQLAGQLQKKVKPLQFKNPEFLWNHEQYKGFLTSLVHVFRNALDHGLESPAERKRMGKPEIGQICIQALPHPTEIEIRISDDGRGLNLSLIKQKMLEKGLSIKGLNPQQMALQILEPWFSTSPVVTQISGRGMGLEAVQYEISKLGGRVEIETAENKGTTFKFFLPRESQQTAIKKAA